MKQPSHDGHRRKFRKFTNLLLLPNSSLASIIEVTRIKLLAQEPTIGEDT